jgi:hypothetical protein
MLAARFHPLHNVTAKALNAAYSSLLLAAVFTSWLPGSRADDVSTSVERLAWFATTSGTSHDSAVML